VAASVAYFLATVVLGNEQPFFAPIAAIISLGLTLGQRGGARSRWSWGSPSGCS
jgi:uncharacterized membrane protein YgaE (UPF0421/DUF939 family)